MLKERWQVLERPHFPHVILRSVGAVIHVPGGLSAVGEQLDPMGLDVLLHVVALDETPEEGEVKKAKIGYCLDIIRWLWWKRCLRQAVILLRKS